MWSKLKAWAPLSAATLRFSSFLLFFCMLSIVNPCDSHRSLLASGSQSLSWLFSYFSDVLVIGRSFAWWLVAVIMHLKLLGEYSAFSSVAQSCPTLWPHGLQHTRLPCPSPTPRACSNSQSIQSVMSSNYFTFCRPLLLPPSVFLTIRVLSSESVLCIRWPKYWSFSFSTSPSNEYSGLISFRMDWLDLLTVQGALKSLLQHQSSKASVLWLSPFFMVQLSHPYMITGKTIALTRSKPLICWTSVEKVMSLLFNMLPNAVH